MELKTEHKNGFSCLIINGDLDANSSVQADEAFKSLLEAGIVNLHLDFSRLNYISSAGIGVILSHQDEISSRNGRLVFSGMSPKVLNVFQLLGLDSLFVTLPTAEEAEAYFLNS